METSKRYGQMIVEAAHMVNDKGWQLSAMAHMIAFSFGYVDESVKRDVEEACRLLDRCDGTCETCNLMREVAMADGSRICVCDGGSDELEQVSASDPACDKYEPRW